MPFWAGINGVLKKVGIHHPQEKNGPEGLAIESPNPMRRI